jgi:hypothetical protein
MRIGVSTPQVHGGQVTLRSLLTRLRNRIWIAAKDAAQARDASTLTVTEAIKERQDQLIAFYATYEELVETLCDAAQYGPTPALERSYGRCRAWMQAHYAPVRRYVVAYLQYSTEDARAGLEHQGEGADAFEALVAAPDVEGFLAHDDGMMISRLNRTREALNLYAEHLRQLSRTQK